VTVLICSLLSLSGIDGGLDYKVLFLVFFAFSDLVLGFVFLEFAELLFFDIFNSTIFVST